MPDDAVTVTRAHGAYADGYVEASDVEGLKDADSVEDDACVVVW